jgi:hypothetical protein
MLPLHYSDKNNGDIVAELHTWSLEITHLISMDTLCIYLSEYYHFDDQSFDLTTMCCFIYTLESFRVNGLSLLQTIHTLLLHPDSTLININGFLVVISFTHNFLSSWLLKPLWFH